MPSLIDIGQALSSSPEAVVVVDGDGQIVAATEAAAVLAGVDRVEHLVRRRSATFAGDGSGAKRLLTDLIAEVMDGYVAHDHFRLADGRPVPGFTSVRRIALAEGPHVLVTMTPRHRPAPTESPTQTGRGMAVLVTDHRWCIVDSTVDAGGSLDLDLPPGGGAALLGMIHPVDSADAIVALARLNAGEHTVTTRVRIRGRAAWRRVSLTASRLCGHTPARLACVLTQVPGSAATTPDGEAADRARRDGRRGTRTEAGVRVPGGPEPAVGAEEWVPGTAASDLRAREPLGRSSSLAGLNPRQREIVERLACGESAGNIAAAMFLNPGTVRNQLSAIYRKFGVHSRSGLLGLFLREGSAAVAGSSRESPPFDTGPDPTVDRRPPGELPPLPGLCEALTLDSRAS